jgi:hypothetical protein
MPILRAIACLVVLLSSLGQAAEDAYAVVTVSQLTITKGALPMTVGGQRNFDLWRRWNVVQAMPPYAVIAGGGEALVEAELGERWNPRPVDANALRVAIRAPAGKPVAGTLFVPKPDYSGMVAVSFTVPVDAFKAENQAEFNRLKSAHYAGLIARGLPGAAWFRHQQRLLGDAATGSTPNRGRERFNLDDTLDLFTGGRAVSENLQLDRNLNIQQELTETSDPAAKPTAPAADKPVEVSTLEGITVREFDWAPLVKELKPKLDPLAAVIPADQHALFFSSFAAMTALMDEADAAGTPILRAFEERSEDAHTKGRYQKQLCLEMTELARRFGPQVVASVACTGSDPYLRTGTDLAILFEPKQPELLTTFLAGKLAAAVQAGAKAVSGTESGVAYTGAVSADRGVCSYQATVGKAVVVTNSLAQLRRLAAVAQGQAPALASAPEYLFFRDRYKLGDDQGALLVLTDATIRRWCSARWRIGDSRRTRAAAILAELTAANHQVLVTGSLGGKPDLAAKGLGAVTLAGSAVQSSLYGNLGFLTPIAELALDQATKPEAEAYQRFRDRYQSNWRAYFDPIALQLTLHERTIAADLTVMPLIAGTEYREMTEITRDAKIPTTAADSHADAVAQLVMAINAESQHFRQAGGMLSGMGGQFEANPFGWLGEAVSLYVDADPFWEELAKAEKPDHFMEENAYRLPLALHAEVKDSLKLVAFLATLHGFVDQSAPGMTRWETRTYLDLPYVRVSPGEGEGARMIPNGDKLAIYYCATPSALVVTLNEEVLKRALDRREMRRKAKAEGKALPPPAPWLGDSLCLRVGERFLPLIQAFGRASPEFGVQDRQRLLAWASLPILNEWKRLFPDQDPVAVHEKLWQTALSCPGGGAYAWNEEWQTMESSVYGCPAAPKDGPGLPAGLSDLAAADFGLTFEDQGLRARMLLTKTPVEKTPPKK